MTPTEQPNQQLKGSFVLFKNEKKPGDHPRKPIYSGSIELPDGTKFELAGWINDGRPGTKMEGKKFIKGEVQPPWVPQIAAPSPIKNDDLHQGDEIPF